MHWFNVFVSRHKWEDEFTKQIRINVFADEFDEARDMVRDHYPQEYVHFYEDNNYLGLCAHFTGRVCLVL
jgi:hypothetical protein